MLQQKDLISQGEKMKLFTKWQSAREAYNSFYQESEHLGVEVATFQKEKSFSLGIFGTHATGFKCFYNTRFRSSSKQCIGVTEIIRITTLIKNYKTPNPLRGNHRLSSYSDVCSNFI